MVKGEKRAERSVRGTTLKSFAASRNSIYSSSEASKIRRKQELESIAAPSGSKGGDGGGGDGGGGGGGSRGGGSR